MRASMTHILCLLLAISRLYCPNQFSNLGDELAVWLLLALLVLKRKTELFLWLPCLLIDLAQHNSPVSHWCRRTLGICSKQSVLLGRNPWYWDRIVTKSGKFPIPFWSNIKWIRILWSIERDWLFSIQAFVKEAERFMEHSIESWSPCYVCAITCAQDISILHTCNRAGCHTPTHLFHTFLHAFTNIWIGLMSQFWNLYLGR